MTPIEEQVIALAGVFTATSMVDKLARTGEIAQTPLSGMLSSLLERNPDSTMAVYGNDLSSLRDGMRALASALERDPNALQRQPLRYALNLLQLERQLDKRDDMLQVMGRRLEQIDKQVAHFGLVNDNVIAACAALYQDTLSTFSLRIQVQGDMRHLQVAQNADKVRALLLCGIRSARLWRQVGGRRWHLVFYRAKLLKTLYSLMRQTNPT
ncbi:high frequency lysogenization protein HflD [Atopomonas sediminilitoris]|uniref:high frequency lysogenization protein HflD n=1 Tax=Atopomonas sediminilitoris TaxID=2919919 RepID=UPI001F4E6A62|nr:high frequency lysogenization protein HflD [Atopomonas sediminilitoris]MCJ8170812.1 high frequency lysogenization protein HflD [Atopomonas sediminilitoris]